MEADQPGKAEDRLRPHRSGASVAGGRKRTPMYHGVANLYSRGLVIQDQPADLAGENVDQVGIVHEIALVRL